MVMLLFLLFSGGEEIDNGGEVVVVGGDVIFNGDGRELMIWWFGFFGLV